MDNEILEEIQNELKKDRAVTFVKTYKTQLIVAFIFIVLSIVVYTQWHRYQMAKSENLTNQLVQIFFDYSSGKDVDLKLIQLSKESNKSLSGLAITINAAIKLRNSEKSVSDVGYKQLSEILSGSFDIIAKDLATIVMILHEMNISSDYASMMSRLELISFARRPFRLLALELLGISSIKNGDKVRAISYFDLIMTDEDATSNMRARATLLKSMAKN